MNFISTISSVFLFLFFTVTCDTTEDTSSTSDDGHDTDGHDTDGHDTGDTDTAPFIDPCDTPNTAADEDGNIFIALHDAMNYTFESSITATTTKVKSSSDIVFNWNEITIDMLGHDFDPLLSVDMMEVMLWKYTKDAFLQDINSETLNQGNIVAMGYYTTDNASDSGHFLNIVSVGGSVEPEETLLGYVDAALYPPENYIYVVMLAEGEIFGQGTKMLAFFQPDSDETDTEVRLTDESTVLKYEAVLTSLAPIAVPPSTGNIVLSWLDNELLTKNAMGSEWIPTKITDVMVAHYENRRASDLEQEFLNLELIADHMWSIRLTAGQEIQLSLLTDETGGAFTGIDETGVWIVALTCSSCRNPAPWFVSVLYPCP